MSAHCIVVRDLWRKAQCDEALGGTVLYLHGEETEQVSFSYGHQFSTASGSLLWPVQGSSTRTLLMQQWMQPCPLPRRTDKWWGWAAALCCTHFKQKQKSTHCAWNKEEYSHTRGKPCPGHVGSSSLGKEVFQAQGPFLGDWGGVQRLHLALSFPTIGICDFDK